MSGASGNPAQRRSSFASRKARGEQGGTAPTSKNEKSHGFDARHYHQNANRHGIHALRTFDCPVCDSKNTIRVDLNSSLREGTVRCTYCMSLRPIPEDMPYPYSTSFVPSLENKADVFFKFNEMYNALLQKQMGGDDVAGPSSSGTLGGRSGGNNASESGTRKRPRDGDDAEDGSGGVAHGEEDGLLGGLAFYPTDADGLDSGVPDFVDGAALAAGNANDHGVYEDSDGETKKVEETVEEAGDRPQQEAPPLQDAVEDDLTGVGMDDVDIAEFFADSD
ncbi:hypothetical protein ABB37_08605 [Leptomonas pyrrhocoris]|uniref:Transcription elongation factor 1 homolog n=1 Tax=Leptomonas pyrrhocoris TaxID=157538 RepID=A0A0M9FT34_LEPPY|nr:hypothetical protein ABB37_08605 [Leptomonas pyrrhocoris]KPA75306.1 hypothetical protein ABB37_08605 [Leptomonas pyrrhocoris]|eukprot:XP_015653745.1 hypothetical protein ABB37_08605 [Leptomonas pyrrhocoris]